ncbi:hypothetical protein H0X06_05080 [Candidatus Dependentiae bacterium]|nr:hypothetical protein [Candidatus Dependentiae bacterium]
MRSFSGARAVLWLCLFLGMNEYFCGNLYGILEAVPLEVLEVIKKHSREITLLEIGKRECPYIFSLAQCDAQCIGLFVGGCDKRAVSLVTREQRKNIILLRPQKVNYDTFNKLAECEHFDVVIIHDLQLEAGDLKPITTAFLKMGDHVFIEATTAYQSQIYSQLHMTAVTRQGEKTLFYTHKPKTVLQKARFTQKSRRVSPRPFYYIKSDFHSKFFIKESLSKPLVWVNGINLVTFAMLEGIYPTDTIIRSRIASLQKRYVHHNDLVLGNIIIQGDRLIPIDFGDKRRFIKSSICITAALKAFKEGNTRLKDPQKWIDNYYQSV